MSAIAAIANPDAPGGIAVIRISGESSLAVSDKIFKGQKIPSEMKGYTCAHGIIKDKDEEIDDVVLTVFRAPMSYTGEDVVEISCHGGRFITKKILRVILDNGANLAAPGEFTKRAFLNGKLSLTQAEAVMDVISSSGEKQLRVSNALKNGSMYRRVQGIKNMLLDMLSGLAAWADFPEEDVPESDPSTLLLQTCGIIEELKKLLSTYDSGRILREGIKTVICGKPNVGKSTLMNLLSGYQRSIVTDIAGTTRDTIEESVKLGELTLCLSDTAGIRDTDDKIESMGVVIAYQKIEESDLVLAVFDMTTPLDEKEKELIEHLKGRKCICIINKTDGESLIEKDMLYSSFENIVEISAKNDEGIDKLGKCAERLFDTNDTEGFDGVIVNERQKICIEKCLDEMYNAKAVLENGEMLDALTVVLDSALAHLLELSGESVSETVIDEVFSRFCVGK